MKSIIQARSPVTFPAFTGERVYMVPFFQKEGLPFDLARWQPTIDQMLQGIDTEQPIYLMVDQKKVLAGTPQRRPGVHIDGYWNPGTANWKGGNWDNTNAIGCHAQPGHITQLSGHNQPEPPREPWPFPANPRPHDGNHNTRPKHFTSDLRPEAILLASNVSACQGYIGNWYGEIGQGGDCQHLKLNHLDTIRFEADRCYAGNITGLHESLPVATDCLRTLVRLNLPGVEI